MYKQSVKYNQNFNVVEYIESDFNGNNLSITKFDDLGRIIYIEYPNGDWFIYGYDEYGNQNYQENSNGYWNKHTFDKYENRTYFEQSSGYWQKSFFNKNNSLAFCIDSANNWSLYDYPVEQNNIVVYWVCYNSKGYKQTFNMSSRQLIRDELYTNIPHNLLNPYKNHFNQNNINIPHV